MAWKTVKLGDVCKIFTGKKDVNQTIKDGLYPFFSCAPTPYRSNDFIYDGNVILVAGNGSFTGRVSYYSGKFDLYQRTYACVPIIEDIDFIYLYFYMKALFEPQYMGGTRGSSIPYIVRGDLSNFEISLPPLETQRRIAAILSSLDDKIENNNRINRNLEAQAQALFKSWFVDFEPFGGVMPEDWKEGTYSDIIESTISGDWGKERAEGNYTHSVACIRGCDFEDMNNGVRGKTPQRYILEKNYQNKGLKNRDIVVEISGGTATVSTGRVCLITEKLLQKYDYDIVCTNFCRTIRPLADYYTYLPVGGINLS